MSLLNGLAPAYILARYDTSNLIGVMYPRKEAYSIVSHEWPREGRKNWDGVQSWGQANFADPVTCKPLNIGEVTFNELFKNNTVVNPSGNYVYSDNLPFYTDGKTQNLVSIVATDGRFGRGSNHFIFSEMPHITNVVRGQTISRRSGSLDVNWTGSGTDFVEISLFVWDLGDSSADLKEGYGVDRYFDNTGNAKLTFAPGQLHNGIADLEIRKYEPRFVTLSSGKRVAVIAESCEEITVNIVD